jgi:hypothetical protein
MATACFLDLSSVDVTAELRDGAPATSACLGVPTAVVLTSVVPTVVVPTFLEEEDGGCLVMRLIGEVGALAGESACMLAKRDGAAAGAAVAAACCGCLAADGLDGVRSPPTMPANLEGGDAACAAFGGDATPVLSDAVAVELVAVVTPF